MRSTIVAVDSRRSNSKLCHRALRALVDLASSLAEKQRYFISTPSVILPVTLLALDSHSSAAGQEYPLGNEIVCTGITITSSVSLSCIAISLALPTWNFSTFNEFIIFAPIFLYLPFYAHPTSNANIYYSLYICEMIIC